MCVQIKPYSISNPEDRFFSQRDLNHTMGHHENVSPVFKYEAIII